MAKLVIVESPAKAKTILKFLGQGFEVKASLGHVRDLPKNPKKKGHPGWIGVDEDRDFAPHYEVLREKNKEETVATIVAAARAADEVLLAADPDREGEAISWHLKEIIDAELGAGVKPIRRVLFNEITKPAIRAAVQAPREIDGSKVDAQETRRILDRIVGYRLSPLLWDKVRRGISAGRVQSVALRMIVDREREIDAFKTQEYWTISADVATAAGQTFEARLVEFRGATVPWKDEDDAGRVPALAEEAAALAVVEHASRQPFTVSAVEAKKSRENPPPPFTTSKLQQEAARRFRLPVARTMRLAQMLYEGKDVGTGGTTGLITYMRTDSVRVATEALDALRAHIGATYGAEHLPAEPRVFKQRSAAQDAHEAIRPTSLELTPERVAPHLDEDELKLYQLIWNRFVASQMTPAEFDVTTVDIAAGDARFRAKGRVLRFAGWRAVYQETREDDAAATAEDAAGAGTGRGDDDRTLPALAAEDRLTLRQLRPAQNHTQPPPRYSEAMLVRALEDNGIGRPSTFASILKVLSERDYVDKLEGRFKPTELGTIVTDLLVQHFGDIVEVGYTARLEAQLDEIEDGRGRRVATLRAFADRFGADLERAKVEMENVKRRQIKTDIACDQCGAMMVKRWGRFGEFLACERYPECSSTRDIVAGAATPAIDETCVNCGRAMTLRRGRFGPFLACTGYPECKTTAKVKVQVGLIEVRKDVLLDEPCPRCAKPLALKHGRYGEYVGCTGYPDCRYTKQEETGVGCPKCAQPIVVRRAKTGRTLYGCGGYPACDFVVWKRPVASPCPHCSTSYRLESVTKRFGKRLICPNEACAAVETVVQETTAETVERERVAETVAAS